jgi:hypothetical protein
MDFTTCSNAMSNEWMMKNKFFMKRLFKSLMNMVAALLFWTVCVNVAYSAGDVVFTLGVVNERIDEPDFALAQYSQLRDYLKTHLEKIGIRVAPLAIARDVPDMADKILTQEADAVIEGVFPTVGIERRTGPLQTTLDQTASSVGITCASNCLT